MAAALKLDNVQMIVDRNEFQANMRTEELVPLEPLGAKFEAFGWSVKRADGHDFDELESALATIPYHSGRPGVLIADTVRGKGLPSIERRADRWFVNFTHEEVEMLLRELHGEKAARLTSETVVVR